MICHGREVWPWSIATSDGDSFPLLCVLWALYADEQEIAWLYRRLLRRVVSISGAIVLFSILFSVVGLCITVVSLFCSI